MQCITNKCIFIFKDELLASQHYDDNSVACIEEKCFVIGIKQYCRYMCNYVIVLIIIVTHIQYKIYGYNCLFMCNE